MKLLLVAFFFFGTALAFATGFIAEKEIERCKTFWSEATYRSLSPDSETLCDSLAEIRWDKKGSFRAPLLFSAISLTPSGRETLTRLKDILTEQKLKILSTHSKEAKKANVTPDMAGAYLNGIIFIDNTAPLVASAVTLFHEMIHADDAFFDNTTVSHLKELHYFIEHPTSEKMEQFLVDHHQYLLKSEHKAHRAQDRFLHELVALSKDFENHIKVAIEQRFLIDFPLSKEGFIDLMHRGFDIPEERISSYFEKTDY